MQDGRDGPRNPATCRALGVGAASGNAIAPGRRWLAMAFVPNGGLFSWSRWWSWPRNTSTAAFGWCGGRLRAARWGRSTYRYRACVGTAGVGDDLKTSHHMAYCDQIVSALGVKPTRLDHLGGVYVARQAHRERPEALAFTGLSGLLGK